MGDKVWWGRVGMMPLEIAKVAKMVEEVEIWGKGRRWWVNGATINNNIEFV